MALFYWLKGFLCAIKPLWGLLNILLKPNPSTHYQQLKVRCQHLINGFGITVEVVGEPLPDGNSPAVIYMASKNKKTLSCPFMEPLSQAGGISRSPVAI
jgi:hypothetical protein